MSLRTTKVGLLKSGLKNWKGGFHRYCTKTGPSQDPQFRDLIKKIESSGVSTAKSKAESKAVYEADLKRLQSNIKVLTIDPKFKFPGQIAFIPDSSSTSTIRTEESALNTQHNGFIPYGISDVLNLINKRYMQPSVLPDPRLRESQLRIEALQVLRELELTAVPCPKTLRDDLKNLFLDVSHDFKSAQVTVLNLTQKSVNDMSAWSPEMEQERDNLTKNFIEVAMAICNDLKELSDGIYWANFIDPSNGRPYIGSFTNACLVETDERYREMGFKIEDLGCCKVIKHVKWAAHAFVGTIFTNAPTESPEVQAILSCAGGR